MTEERIETTNGLLTAELWHVGAYVVMEFDDNFSAPVNGEYGIRLLKRLLLEFGNNDYRVVECGDCNFKVYKSDDGLCVMTYKGTYRERFNTSVTLAEPGRLRLIEILDAAIAQALTPEQRAERRRAYSEWEQRTNEWRQQTIEVDKRQS